MAHWWSPHNDKDVALQSLNSTSLLRTAGYNPQERCHLRHRQIYRDKEVDYRLRKGILELNPMHLPSVLLQEAALPKAQTMFEADEEN
ncbi:hypothetical protein VNO78_34269 [Psophocarpus tetragonolobus]|uniref:Uncharacterized protein n=1 Tax=Psophocarpus tetragonolobus TaxID=3891 RepID=A0AAN9NV87_PSOTE